MPPEQRSAPRQPCARAGSRTHPKTGRAKGGRLRGLPKGRRTRRRAKAAAERGRRGRRAKRRLALLLRAAGGAGGFGWGLYLGPAGLTLPAAPAQPEAPKNGASRPAPQLRPARPARPLVRVLTCPKTPVAPNGLAAGCVCPKLVCPNGDGAVVVVAPKGEELGAPNPAAGTQESRRP